MVAHVPEHRSLSEYSDPPTSLLEYIRARLTPHEFTTWFEHTPLHFFHPDRFVLTLRNRFRKNWVEKNYRNLIVTSARDLFQTEVRLAFEIDSGPPVDHHEGADSQNLPRSLPPTADKPPGVTQTNQREPSRHSASCETSLTSPHGVSQYHQTSSSLHRDYRFDTLVLGSTNSVAHAATAAVCSQPSKCYNPLLLYGETGLGKTHIAHAICHHFLETRTKRVSYISAHEFIDFYMTVTTSQDSRHFRYYFSDTDVLVIDDVHYLAARDGGQEDFLRFFTEFVEAGKQLVFTSRKTEDNSNIAPLRLTSRFRSGLMARIEPHDFEMQVSILLRKARLRNVEFSMEVAEFIARSALTGSRHLEGALLAVIHFANARQRPIDLNLAKAALLEALPSPAQSSTVTVNRILRAVQDFYQLRSQDLLSRSKVRAVVLPRHVGMFLARQLTQLSLVQIGSIFGGRDHTTVLYAQDRVETLLRSNPQIRKDLQIIRDRISDSQRPAL